MSKFLGIGLGPIQTGIFLLGARDGGFDRIAVADVDKNLVSGIRAGAGTIRINIAGKDGIFPEEIRGIETFDPTEEQDLEDLIEFASDADELATALPGVKFFKHISPWLRRAFESKPAKRRLIYTAENDNRAAEILEESIGCKFPDTHFLNTVIGKMSGVISADECRARNLPGLCPACGRGHLVEEFNKILISSCPRIESRKTSGLLAKDELLPFEEAKLYGHNAIHMLLGLHASEKGLKFMHELSDHPELIKIGREAFIAESGLALCNKWTGHDLIFTEDGFRQYAEDLLERMTNPFLTDSVERVCRDLERKLSWNDRIVGTIRLALSQNVHPKQLLVSAKFAVRRLFGTNPELSRIGFEKLWPAPWSPEHERIFGQIC